jgi:hypothetical protein
MNACTHKCNRIPYKHCIECSGAKVPERGSNEAALKTVNCDFWFDEGALQ